VNLHREVCDLKVVVGLLWSKA